MKRVNLKSDLVQALDNIHESINAQSTPKINLTLTFYRWIIKVFLAQCTCQQVKHDQSWQFVKQNCELVQSITPRNIDDPKIKVHSVLIP